MASSDFDDDNLVQSYPFLASILLIFIIIFLILSLKRIFYEVPFSNDKKYKNFQEVLSVVAESEAKISEQIILIYNELLSQCTKEKDEINKFNFFKFTQT